jgi:prepilin-type N-terminal cleavage/methylation domain-containing protein
MRTRHRQRAFTLVELAVVVLIVGLLLGSAMMTLQAQSEQRAIDDTRRRLDTAVEAIIAFAVVNGRLPCPAVGGATGVESPGGGGACTSPYGGFLPASTIGFQPTDASQYAVDVWNNRIRYVVAGADATKPLLGCTGASTIPHFTSAVNLKTNGISCRPGNLDLDVKCSTFGAGVSATCNSATQVVAMNTIAFIVYSTGKNGATPAVYGNDENENIDADAMFINRTPSPTESSIGYYDDIMVMVPAGVVYTRLVAAGVLP